MTLDPRPAGWATLRLDLDGVRSKAGLMDACAEAFALPRWFGRNWDALADCLIDLSWLPDVPGRVVVVSSWRGFARARPGDWETLREVLEEAVGYWREAAAPLEVLLADAPAGPEPEPGPEG
ncbi:barstar family protein [Streptomyces venezuelae]|uniref:barstar family protein n=1 Tax=Streptomyces venezuelae TaxID=54571 RepID=UPI00123A8245|nr:barstar family protein [Streptomyces venezuelae]